jgi:type IV pilus assembly protein PilM
MQIFRKKEKGLVGLEIEAGSIAATEIQVNGSARVVGTAIEPLPADAFHEGEVTDPEALTEALRELFSKNKLSKRVRLGIANQRVVVRTIRLPALDDPQELEAAVRFQAQEQIPMPIDQAILDHRVVGGVPASGEDSAKVDVVVVAARRDMIESSLAPLRNAGLQPVGIDLSAFGLIRALIDSVPPSQEGQGPAEPQATLFCNVGDATNLAVANGRSCLFTRVAPVGVEAIVSGLSASAGLTPEHAAMWLSHVGFDRPVEEIEGDPGTVAAVRDALETGAAALQDELRLSLDFYSGQEGALPIGNLVLGGPGSAIAGLPERVQSFLGLPLQIGRPAALSELDAASAARLTLSYGLALDS